MQAFTSSRAYKGAITSLITCLFQSDRSLASPVVSSPLREEEVGGGREGGREEGRRNEPRRRKKKVGVRGGDRRRKSMVDEEIK